MQPDQGYSKEELARYRLETARSDLRDAELLLKNESYRSANNRAYYAIFHAVSAVHALNGKSYKRHKDALGNFNRDYVRTGIFDPSFGRKISDAERIRNASDYDDFYIVRREDVVKQVAVAKEVVAAISEYCERQYQNVENE